MNLLKLDNSPQYIILCQKWPQIYKRRKPGLKGEFLFWQNYHISCSKEEIKVRNQNKRKRSLWLQRFNLVFCSSITHLLVLWEGNQGFVILFVNIVLMKNVLGFEVEGISKFVVLLGMCWCKCLWGISFWGLFTSGFHYILSSFWLNKIFNS